MAVGEKKGESASAGIVVLTEAQLRALIGDAVREAMGPPRAAEGYLDTAQAAAYLGTTVSSVRAAVARGNIIPDHRGRRGGGLKGNRFSRETLDAYCRRK